MIGPRSVIAQSAGTNFTYQFTQGGLPIVRCDGCRLLMRNPQPSDAELGRHLRRRLFLRHEREPGTKTRYEAEFARLKQATAAGYLDRWSAISAGIAQAGAGRRLLDLGTGLGDLLVEAQARGYDVDGRRVLGELGARAPTRGSAAPSCVEGTLETVGARRRHFDVCVLSDVIEHTRDPMRVLRPCLARARPGRRRLRRDAEPRQLVGAADARTLDGVQGRAPVLLRQRDPRSQRSSAGFEHVRDRSAAARRSARTTSSSISSDSLCRSCRRWARAPAPCCPRAAQAPPIARRRQRHRRGGAARRLPPAGRSAPRPRVGRHAGLQREAHVSEVIEPLLRQDDPGPRHRDRHRREQLDGRDARRRAQRGGPSARQRHLQERPRGKGHAVGAGLAHATGDFVLIQDADLEYDLDDYEVLLEPLRTFRRAFVLGVASRPGRAQLEGAALHRPGAARASG